MATISIVHILLCIIYTSISIAAVIIICQLLYNLFPCYKSPSNQHLEISELQFSQNSHKEWSHSSTRGTQRSNSPESAETKHKKPKQEILKFFKYSSTICVIIFGIVCFIVNTYPFIVLFHPKFDANPVAFYAMIGGIWELWFIGRMVLSLIFIGRLYFTFRSSAYQYSKRFIVLLIFCWCLMPLFAILAIFLYFIAGLLFTIIFGSFFVFIDILLSFILLYSYIKKLFELISTGDDKLFIPLMTKYTLIYTVSFITTFIMFICLILSPFIGSSRSSQEIVWIFLLMDCLTNISCLWLKFHFAQKYYTKCCKLLDDKCQLYCNYYAKKKRETLNDEAIAVEIQKASSKSEPEDI